MRDTIGRCWWVGKDKWHWGYKRTGGLCSHHGKVITLCGRKLLPLLRHKGPPPIKERCKRCQAAYLAHKIR